MSDLFASVPGLSAELAGVERLIRRALFDQSALATRMALHTFLAGGKRLRPALCLIAGRFGEESRRPFVQRAAAGMEMVHMATLVHDDIVDRSPTRRGRPTAASLWGSGPAVLAGDFLFASSFELLHDDEDATVLRLTASMVRQLCAGAIEEVESAGRLDHHFREYYRRIYRKTAVFVETACRAGAVAARAPASAADALARYGRLTGMAFQIADDVLDFAGDPAQTGKPVGGDLRSGILTLPMIYARDDASVGPLLERCFGRRRLAQKTVQRLAGEMKACGALESALADAERFAAQAADALTPLQGLGPVEPLRLLAAGAVRCGR